MHSPGSKQRKKRAVFHHPFAGGHSARASFGKRVYYSPKIKNRNNLIRQSVYCIFQQ